eukprot:365974-Chlamydomonas_euryale.AAC.8
MPLRLCCRPVPPWVRVARVAECESMLKAVLQHVHAPVAQRKCGRHVWQPVLKLEVFHTQAADLA